MNARRHLAFLTTSLWLAASASAADRPAASDWAGEPEGQARLIAAQDAVGADGRLDLGVEIRLAPGWHTYWRDPGESGAPPVFDWAGSENLGAIELRWPAPRRFEAFGLAGYGWEEAVVFPLVARPARPGEPLRVRLRLDYQICEEICIPVAAELALDLPAGSGQATAFAPLLERWSGRVPAQHDGLEILETALSGAPGEEVLLVRARAAAPFRNPDLFAEAPPPFRFARPRIEVEDGEARFELPVRAGREKRSLVGHDVTLTLTAGERAVERRVRLSEKEPQR